MASVRDSDLAVAFREALDLMRRRYLLVFEPAESIPAGTASTFASPAESVRT